MSFPAYASHKDSVIEELASIPSDWQEGPFKAIASCNDEVLDESFPAEQLVKYVEISDVSLAEGIKSAQEMSFEQAPSRARRIVRQGDVLVSTVRTYLKAIAYVDRDEPNLVASTGFAVIRARNACPKFLGYVAQSEYFIARVIAASVGVSYPAVNASEIMRLPVAFPDLETQGKIAAFLDGETAKIDRLIAAQRKLIDLLDEKKQSLISHAVTKGLNPDVPTKESGVQWLGDVPENWQVRSIKSLATGSGTLFTDGDWIESKNLSTDGIRYITTGNVGQGAYKEQGSGYISESTFEELNCTEVLPGDVLVSRLNQPIGRACLAPNLGGRVATSVDNVIFRPAPEFDPAFVVYRFSASDYLHELNLLASGTTMQRVSRTELGGVRIAWPPHSEQLQIVGFLDRITKQIDILTKKTQLSIDLLKERRSALISAAVTGKIDVRGLVQAPQEQQARESA